MVETQSTENSNRSWIDSLKNILLGTDMVGFIIRLAAVPVLIYLAVFIWGLVSALLDPEGAAGFWSYFRNLIEIILSMAAILIFIALGVLVVQIARFVNLLRSEIKPLSEDTKNAMKNVRVTTEFIQKHGIAPIIRFQAFLAGVIAFLNEIMRISRLLQQRKEEEEKNKEEAEYFN